MTAIVGIRCQDGIVLGTDSSATFGVGNLRTIEQPTDHKLEIISEKVMVAGTGQIGLGQRFTHIVKKAYDLHLFKGDAIDVVTTLSHNTIQDFARTAAPKQYGALLAFPIENKPYLCEFAAGDLQPEIKDDHLWYCSMGSSQPITDPFLGFFRRIFWKDGLPSVSEGVLAALWTIQLAIELNPGGVGGDAVIGVLAKGTDGKLVARYLSDDELAEQREAIDAAEEHLRAFRDTNRLMTGKDFPDEPT